MLTIINIGILFGLTDRSRVEGREMSEVGVLRGAYLKSDGGVIVDFGVMDYCVPQGECFDAKGGVVMPTFCDSHTHLVYAASREGEFLDRVKGLSYEEIARRGGGILNSADRLREASEESLFATASERCERILATGTGAVEIKSGYGLDLESELKMLRVIERLKSESKLVVKSTFLGAHAVGREFAGRQDAYVDYICREMIPEVGRQKLADFVDVFCDEGFFTVAQTERMLNEAAKFGIVPKIHANELAVSGGVQVGVKCKALSVDHLERMDGDAIAALMGSRTMATGLPGASFFLGIPFAPLREMVDAGLGVAIASDFNPGSSPNGNMFFMVALSVMKSKLTTVEALAAATINSAYAMGVDDKLGSIAKGKIANLIITKPLSSLDYIPYSYNENHINRIIIKGEII